MMEAKLLLLVLLGPVAALYDFATNPNAPPQIFVAQWNGSFPNHQIEPRLVPQPKIHKRVTVSRPS
jgi:hypothetical protein